MTDEEQKARDNILSATLIELNNIKKLIKVIGGSITSSLFLITIFLFILAVKGCQIEELLSR